MVKLFPDRHDYILRHCKGKDVLHLGCVGGGVRADDKLRPWLHKRICKVAKSCEGLDMSKEEIPRAEELSGSKIHYGNAENFSLKKKYDVVVAGEIIEHLTNVGTFFDAIRKHLRPGGIVVITTPNAFNLGNIFKAIFGHVPGWRDHSIYFDIHTLKEMHRKCGFKVVKSYYQTQYGPPLVWNYVYQILGAISPILHKGLVTVAVPVKKVWVNNNI